MSEILWNSLSVSLSCLAEELHVFRRIGQIFIAGIKMQSQSFLGIQIKKSKSHDCCIFSLTVFNLTAFQRDVGLRNKRFAKIYYERPNEVSKAKILVVIIATRTQMVGHLLRWRFQLLSGQCH